MQSYLTWFSVSLLNGNFTKSDHLNYGLRRNNNTWDKHLSCWLKYTSKILVC